MKEMDNQPSPDPLVQPGGGRRGPGVLGAVLLCAILIGAASGVFFLAQRGITRPLQTPAAPTCHAQSAQQQKHLSSIHMSNAGTGWGWSDSQDLLRTTDGGCHWTIIKGPWVANLTWTYFLSDTIAWIGTDEQWFKTTDGGRTWSDGALPPDALKNSGLAKIMSLDFLNAQTGWLMIPSFYALAPGSSTPSMGIDLYQTLDGGQHWHEQAGSGASLFPVTGTLPRMRNYSGVRFLNTTTGWIAGIPAGPESALYVTHDAGHTWFPQSLPLPQGVKQAAIASPTLPQFFSDRDGILQVVLQAADDQALLGVGMDVTHDGGSTWQNRTFLSFSSESDHGSVSIISTGASVPDRSMRDPIFLDKDFGWNTTGSVTNDGGQHWRSVTEAITRGAVWTSFISNQVGWALVAAHANQFYGPTTLFVTMNGGKTWSRLPYSVS